MPRVDALAAVYVGGTELAAVYLGEVLLFGAEDPPPTPSDLGIVGYGRAQIGNVNGLSLDFTQAPGGAGGAYVPVEGDVVLFGFAVTTTGVTWTCPAGWVNPLGGSAINMPSDTTIAQALAAHVVTSGEETGGSATYAMPGCFANPEDGEQIGCVIRGADTTTIFDTSNIGNNATTTTAQFLPSLEGDDMTDGSMILSFIFSDATATYTEPAGWDLVQASTNGIQGGSLYVLETPAVAGADLAATAITSSASDEHVAISVAILAAS